MRPGCCRTSDFSRKQKRIAIPSRRPARAEEFYDKNEQVRKAEPSARRPGAHPRRYCRRTRPHRDRGYRCQRCAIDRAARAADPGRGPHHPDEFAADDVPGRTGPDHRCHRAADHRPPVQRRQQSVLGDYGLSAGLDRGGPGIRYAERHLWPPRHDHGLAQPVHGGFDPLRDGAQYDGADPGAGPAGARRRRHHARGADRDLRRGQSARARPVPGLFLAACGWRPDCSGRYWAACSPNICTGR